MVGDVLPLTELQNNSQLLVEAVTCLISSPFPFPDGLCFHGAAAWSLMAGRFLLRYTDYADSLQDFKSCDVCMR